MPAITSIANSLVSISQFNKGQSAKIFDKLKTQRELVVLKNNHPAAYILSPKEYERLIELEEDYYFLMEANKRLKENEGKERISMEEVMKSCGISQEDLDAIEDEVIE